MNDSIHNLMNEWLDRYGIDDEKVTERIKPANNKNRDNSRRSAKKIPVQKKLDLHGLTVKEALTALDHFITKSKREGVKKILIVHGKGIHSTNGPVLRDEIHAFLQTNPKIGQVGTPGRHEGGSGAVWALIR